MRVCFYSYKGGVGRSQALVNAGMLLSRMGIDTGLVDVDLEAPGLHHILGVAPEAHQSLIEHLASQDLNAVSRRCVDIAPDLVADHDVTRSRRPGRLVLLPSLPDRMRLNKIPDNARIVSFFDDSLRLLQKTFGLKHLLLDTRTGFARIAPLPLQVADMFVFVARVDEQNAVGIRELLRVCEPRKVPKLLVGCQVPKADDEITETRVRQAIARFEERVGRKIDVEVPFDRSLLLGDVIPSAQFSSDRPVNKAFQEIADRIEALST